jgi:predicted negative regulator of RcsB-dependent stress response
MLKDSRNIAAFVCLVLLVVIVIFAWPIFLTNRLGASAQEMALQVVENAFSKGYLLRY